MAKRCYSLRAVVLLLSLLLSGLAGEGLAQINTERVMMMGRNALFYEDYVLSIQRFNQVINAKPYLAEPYFYRGLAKFYLDDYSGAEQDCTSAIDINPYVHEHYVLRALCRVNSGQYREAEVDYRKSLEQDPMDRSSWYNLVLCHLQLEEFVQADSALDVMLLHWPREASNYTLKAQVAFCCKDTLSGEKWVDRALEVDEYCGNAWSMKAMVCMARQDFPKAEDALDRSLLQSPKVAGLYINRALCRYSRNNLRGAMTDYDMALELEPGNYLGHYNRGLLRAQVGDDNRAIEDLNFVLEQEPDNMLVLYNRALLLDNTGDYKGALRDISAVIAEYPEFWAGYQARAAIRRKVGDVYGAERDEFKVLKASMEARSGKRRSITRTRKKSDRNIEDYNKLVEADSEETRNEYESEYRGRVQDRKVEADPRPYFVLSYFSLNGAVKGYHAYSKLLEEKNAERQLFATLHLTDSEVSPSEARLRMLFDDLSATLYFRLAMDHYHVRDFESALHDLDSLILLDASSPLAFFLRAQVRLAMLGTMSAEPGADTSMGYRLALADLERCIALAPDFHYAIYNCGNIHLQLHEYNRAQEAFTRVLALDAHFPDAYYNRGVSHILSGDIPQGLADLSQAGELGLYTAYNLIKRYSAQKK